MTAEAFKVPRPLEWVPTQELLEELERRFETMVFGAAHEPRAESRILTLHLSGDILLQSGLVARIQKQIHDNFEDLREEGEDHERQ